MRQKEMGIVPVLSVVISAHNAEQRLGTTLESVVEAIDGCEQIEVIIINDSSTDGTQAIIDNYRSRFNRVSTFNVDFTNLGKVKAFGIQQATGDYVTFSDDDDIVRRYAFSEIVDFLQKEKPDMVLSTLAEVKEEHVNEQVIQPTQKKAVDAVKISQHKAIVQLMGDKVYGNHTQGKFIKREIYLKADMQPFSCYEDISVMPGVFIQSENIWYWKSKMYFYIKRKGSLIWEVEKDPVKIGYYFSCIKIMEKILPERYGCLIACYWITLCLRYLKGLPKKDQIHALSRMRTLTNFRFFLSPHVRVSFKRKAIQLRQQLKDK